MGGEIVEDGGFRLRVDHKAGVADVGGRVGKHAVGVIGKVRGFSGDFDAWDLAGDAARFFVAFGLAGFGNNAGRAELFHIGEVQFGERSDGNTIALRAIVIDFHVCASGQSGGASGVIHPRGDLIEINGIGVADVKIGGSFVWHNVGRGAAFGDGAFDARLRTHVGANAVDVVEELDDGLEGVSAVPGGQFMRGRTVKCVLHTIDIHATGAESGRGPRG